jgi:hypothetical protein
MSVDGEGKLRVQGDRNEAARLQGCRVRNPAQSHEFDVDWSFRKCVRHTFNVCIRPSLTDHHRIRVTMPSETLTSAIPNASTPLTGAELTERY